MDPEPESGIANEGRLDHRFQIENFEFRFDNDSEIRSPNIAGNSAG